MTKSGQNYLKTWGVMWAIFGVVIIMFIACYARVDGLNDEIGNVKDQLEESIDGVRDEVSSSKDYLGGRIDGVLTEIGKVNARVDDIYKLLVGLQERE